MISPPATNTCPLCFRRNFPARWSRKHSIISRIRVRTALELADENIISERENPQKLQQQEQEEIEIEKVEIAAIPRKRGRPRKIVDLTMIKPDTLPKRKRGRPRKHQLPMPSLLKENVSLETAVSVEPSGKKKKIEKKQVQEVPEKEQGEPVKVKEEPAKLKMYRKVKGGGFMCKVCHKYYSHRYKVTAHIRIQHTVRETFKCEECNKIFKTKFQYNMHSNQHRENSSDFMVCCDKCEYRAKSKYYLKTHEIRKHTNECNFECDVCKKRFKMKSDLKFHLGRHNAFEHMCDACGRMYTSQDSLNKHRRVVHVNDYKFRCPRCHQKLLTQENLDNHMKSHEQLHGCDECDLKFTKKYYVTRHKKRVHKVEKRHLCSVCGKAFVCTATLRVHYLIHAKVKPYMCNVCGFTFTQRSSMMLHWKRKHPDAGNPPPPVLLTNFFDAIQTEVNRMSVTEQHRQPPAAATDTTTAAATDTTTAAATIITATPTTTTATITTGAV